MTHESDANSYMTYRSSNESKNIRSASLKVTESMFDRIERIRLWTLALVDEHAATIDIEHVEVTEDQKLLNESLKK